MKTMLNNYKNMITELNDEMTEGGLSEKDSVQVLRAEEAIFQDYCPVVDWYYDADTMKEEMETPLEEMYLEEEFSKEEWEGMKKDLQEYKDQYEAEKEKLVTMAVKDLVTEMKQMTKLFSSIK